MKSKRHTIRAKRLKDGVLVEILPDGSAKAFPENGTDWAALQAMTDDEVNAAAATDRDNPPRTAERAKHMRRIPKINVMRRVLGRTQEEFSARFQIPLGTLRDWAQGKRVPDQAARAYLAVIARNPKAVTEALTAPLVTAKP